MSNLVGINGKPIEKSEEQKRKEANKARASRKQAIAGDMASVMNSIFGNMAVARYTPEEVLLGSLLIAEMIEDAHLEQTAGDKEKEKKFSNAKKVAHEIYLTHVKPLIKEV